MEYAERARRNTPAVEKNASTTKKAGQSYPTAKRSAISTTRSAKLGPERALADRNATVQLAIVQYQAGRRDLLWVEQLQTEQLAVESNVIQLRNAQIANRIQLHLALGGSFDAVPSVAELGGGT